MLLLIIIAIMSVGIAISAHAVASIANNRTLCMQNQLDRAFSEISELQQERVDLRRELATKEPRICVDPGIGIPSPNPDDPGIGIPTDDPIPGLLDGDDEQMVFTCSSCLPDLPSSCGKGCDHKSKPCVTKRA